jgi:hypothetical protein
MRSQSLHLWSREITTYRRLEFSFSACLLNSCNPEPSPLPQIERRNHPLRAKSLFINPLAVVLYTTSLLALGWTLGEAGSRHALPEGRSLLLATALLLVHDAAIAVLLAIAASRIPTSGKK